MQRRAATNRLLLASLLLLALFLFLAIAAYLSGRKVEQFSRLISEDAVPGSAEAYAMRTAFATNFRSVAGAVFADDAEVQAAQLKLAHDSDQDFLQASERYRQTIRINPTQDSQLLDKVVGLHGDFNRQRDTIEAMIRRGDRAGGRAFFEHEFLAALTAATHAADELVNYNQRNDLNLAREITGSIRLLHYTVVIVLILAVICGAILASNLSIRRREEQKLLESERRLRQVLDNLHVFVALLERDGTIIEVNRTPLGSIEFSRADMLGKKFQQTPGWNSSPEAQARLQGALHAAAAGENVRYDLNIPVADGNVAIDFGCGPILDSSGRATQLVVTAIDISERKQLEEQFLRAQRMEAIGTLSSGLAHDLNNILAPMLMAAGLLKMKLDSPRDQGTVAMIETGAQRGANIIRQLLTLGLGSGGARGEVQVRHLLKDIAHIMQETFPRSIELHHSAAAGLWPVVADVTQLHQVLLNLCINARDAMPQGGKLSLTAVNLPLTEEGARSHPEAKAGRYVVLEVTDSGEGIPPEVISRIFDPFFTTKPAGKGTGLGLASVLGIVKGHGGFVTVDSQPGQGSAFKVYLPAAERAGTAPGLGAADQLPHGQGELILLVDDEAAMREATREMLELHNYRVITAADGEAAIRQFVEHRDDVNLVLTDIDMPIMGGPELIRSLRVLESDLRFLLLTGSEQNSRIGELAALGAHESLHKPCDPALLLKTLAKMLGHPPPA